MVGLEVVKLVSGEDPGQGVLVHLWLLSNSCKVFQTCLEIQGAALEDEPKQIVLPGTSLLSIQLLVRALYGQGLFLPAESNGERGQQASSHSALMQAWRKRRAHLQLGKP